MRSSCVRRGLGLCGSVWGLGLGLWVGLAGSGVAGFGLAGPWATARVCAQGAAPQGGGGVERQGAAGSGSGAAPAHAARPAQGQLAGAGGQDGATAGRGSGQDAETRAARRARRRAAARRRARARARRRRAAAAGAGVAVGAAAGAAAAHGSSPTPDQAYFGNRDLVLTPQEELALQALETNRPRSRPTSKPIVGQDGSIRFMFGSQHTSILCAPLQVCDVALQPGEHVSSVNLGDTARWSVEPAITGVAPQEVQHLIIKPADVGLETSLVVTTDRRTYHLRLRSHRTKFMPSVSFLYPEDAEAKWAALRRPRGRSATGSGPAVGAVGTGQTPRRANQTDLGALSFNYEIEGDSPPWKPLRVYNDGFKTVIEMPYAMRHTEAPALLVVRADGGLFSDDETVIVNYRVHDTKYIVDSIFDKAILISGVGTDQQRVTITRE